MPPCGVCAQCGGFLSCLKAFEGFATLWTFCVEKAFEGFATLSVSVLCVVFECDVNIEKALAGAAVRGSVSVGART